jgi:hypothetical protein
MTELSKDAQFLLNTHQMMRGWNRSKFEQSNQMLVSSYRAALNVVASQAKRSDGKYAELNEKSKQRGPILAAFTTGLSLVDEAIFGGYPVQAVSLVRQELEAIAALAEIAANTRINKKTPNIKILNIHGGIYGLLSQIAHYADSKWARRLILYETPPNLIDLPTNSTEAWSISPKYSEHLSGILGIHIFLILHFTEHQAIHMEELHNMNETKEEETYAEESLKILVSEGIVEIVA